MKIALVNPTIIMRRPIAELAHLLSQDGHEITIVTPKEKKQDKGALRHYDNYLSDPDIKIVPIYSIENKKLLWSIPTDFCFYSKIKRILKENDVVQIWAPYYIISLAPIIIKRLHPSYRAKIILTFDTFPGYSFSMGWFLDFFFNLYHRIVGRVFFNSVTMVTIYGKSLLKWAERLFLRQKIVVIPTGISLDKQEKPSPEILRIIRNRLDCSDKFVILFIGILNKRKGVDVLIRAAGELKKKMNNFRVLINGDGPDKNKFINLVATLGIDNFVKFLGTQRNVKKFYRVADVLVLPSRGEGLPGVIMEAMSFGLPVIASDIPCIPDLIKNSQNGFLVQMNDYEEFASKINIYLQNDNLRKKARQKSLNLIQEYDWYKIKNKYHNLYQRVCKT